MKKLLCVLMVGMVFGQTKLEIRSYQLNIFHESNGNNDFNLNQITGYDLEFAQVSVGNIESDDFFSHPDFSIRLNCDYSSFEIFRWDNSTLASYTMRPYYKDNNCQLYVSSGNSSLEFNIQVFITAEFPQEDTGYIEEGFDFCLHTGANLVSSPCREAVLITDAIPPEIANNLTGIITEGGATSNVNGNWVGSMTGIGGGKGYWIVSEIDGCFNYTCSEN